MERVFEIHKRFRNRLLLYLVGAVLVPTIVLLGFGYFHLTKVIGQQLTQQLEAASEEASERSSHWHERNVMLLDFLRNEIQYEDHPKDYLQRLFVRLLASNPYLYGIQILDPQGNVVVRSITHSNATTPQNYADRMYFQQAIAGRYYSEPVISKMLDRPALCSGAPIYKNNKIINAVAVCSLISTFTSKVDSTAFGKTGYIFSADERGQLIRHPQRPYLQPLDSDVEKIPFLAFKNGVFGRLEYQADGQEYIAFIKPTKNNWVSVALESKSEVIDQAQAGLKIPAICLLVYLIFGIVFTYFAVEKATRPIHELAKAVSELGRQNFKARVNIQTNDELKLLAQSFNTMAERIEEHTNELNEKVKVQSQKLIYSEKMSSLGEMAGGIAHEINNPLAILSIQIQHLKFLTEKEPLTARRAFELLEKMDNTCMRISQIVKGLSAFSRDGTQDPLRTENLSAIISDAMGLCSESLRRQGIHVGIICDPELTLECQAVPVSQVLVNLIMNSRDALADLEKKWIRVEVVDDGASLLVKITDSGNGIVPEIQQKMMQPFFTSKPVGEGTGLGLSISNGIIEHHHGKLWYNTESENTQFCFRLPKKQDNS